MPPRSDTPRAAAGNADGCLLGTFPQPAMGHTCAAGAWLRDDFVDLISDNWTLTTIVGAPAWSMVAPTAGTEFGIAQITTPGTATQGGVALRSAVADMYGPPLPGSRWVAKVAIVGAVASYTAWSGFVSGTAAPSTAAATKLIGVRSVGANLFGVVKNGAGAGNETTVDLGFTCEGSAYKIVGFEVGGTVGAETVQFFYYDCSDRMNRGRTNVGSTITTNLPTGAMFSCALGLITDENVAKTGLIDFWEIGGRTAR